MMLLPISALLVVIYTIVLCINAKKSEGVSATSGKCVAMSYGMISGTAVGLIAGIYMQGELAYSTVLSIGISAILGFFVGRIFGLNGIVEALAASFMGAMMGAMLGEMLTPSNQLFMVIVMDLMYALVVTGLLLMIGSEHKKVNKSSTVKIAPLLIMLLLSFSSVSIVAALDQSTVDVEQELQNDHEHHH